jgi:hypothetical protein
MSHVPNFLRTTDRAGGNNLHDESAGFFGPAQIGLETVPIPKPPSGRSGNSCHLHVVQAERAQLALPEIKWKS